MELFKIHAELCSLNKPRTRGMIEKKREPTNKSQRNVSSVEWEEEKKIAISISLNLCTPHTIHGAWKIKTFIQLLDSMFVHGIHNSYNSIN